MTLRLTSAASPNAWRRGRDDSAWNLEKSAGHDQLAARSARQAAGTGQDRSQCARLRKGDEGLAIRTAAVAALERRTVAVCINDSPREVDDLDSYGAGGTQHIKGRTGGTQSRSALRIGQIELTLPESNHDGDDRESRRVIEKQ